MTKLKGIMGYVANRMVGVLVDRLDDNRAAFFDMVVAIKNAKTDEDRDAAVRLAKAIWNNETLVREVLSRLRAGDLEEARQMVLDAPQSVGERLNGI